MQHRVSGRHVRYQFDSFADVARYLRDTPKTWSAESSLKPPSASWDNNCDYKQSWDYAYNGWLEGARRAEEALQAFTPKDPAPDTKVDFYGHVPHVPRFCAGAPDSMIRHAPQATMGSGRVLTLYVAISTISYAKAKEIMNYGVAIAQYVNQIETQGIRVELYATFRQKFHSRDHDVTWTWRIKDADQPLDLAVLAFAVGHPASFRRIGFGLIEHCEAPTEYGYGMPSRVRMGDLIDPPNGAYILNGMNKVTEHAPTAEKALEYITKEINAALEASGAD